MKKLIDIIKIPQLNQCHLLELDFKTQRHNIKRYLKSLKELKSRSKVDHQYFANLIQASSSIANDHGTIKKKNSQLDYYMVNEAKLFKVFNIEAKKLDTFYEEIFNQTKDLTQKVIKYLDQSKQSFNRVSSEHEKVVKQYGQKCYPQTTTILYILGFVANQKVKKVQDSLKEQGLVKETEMYITILNTYLDQMQNLKNEISNLFKQYFMGAAQLWIKFSEDINKQISTYQIKNDQIEMYYKQTGGAVTDRSDRSNKDNQTGQQEI